MKWYFGSTDTRSNISTKVTFRQGLKFKRRKKTGMGDAVLRVHSRLQLLARENWLALEESHVRNLSWLQEEFLQISRSLDVKARLNQPRLDASEPLYRYSTVFYLGHFDN